MAAVRILKYNKLNSVLGSVGKQEPGDKTFYRELEPGLLKNIGSRSR